jgi:PAS domain S-box-containing protein
MTNEKERGAEHPGSRRFSFLQNDWDNRHALSSWLLLNCVVRPFSMSEVSKNPLSRKLFRYAAAAVSILLAFLLRRMLEAMLDGGLPPFITFFPVVMLVAMFGGFWLGVFATLLSAVLTAGWILPHAGPFAIARLDQVSLGLFICVGYSMSVFADVYRETHHRAELYEKKLAVRETEAELQQSRERLQVTLRSIGDAVITCDAIGRITFMNPKAEELLGRKTEDVTGTPIQEVLRVIDDETAKPMEDIAWQVLRERRPVRRTDHLALLDKDGSSIPIEDSAAPILDANGELTGVVLVFHSVTEQRRAQEKVRASERRYRTLVEMSPEAVAVHLSGKIVYANAAALRLFGAKYLEELQGRYMWDLIHPDDRELVRERVAAAESGGIVPLRELRIVQLDGTEVAAEATAANIDWQGSVAVQSILRDITARKAAEAVLIRNEKLASVGRMAASIAHEINNPLAAVMNTVFLARKTEDVPASAVQYLEIAEEELKRISHITRQVLGFYRESSVLKPVAVDSIMDSALDLLTGKIRGKRAKIEKRYCGNLEVRAVGGELRQVFSNLLANSLDSLGDDGTVRIRIREGQCAKSGGRTVRITVADNGSGIKQAIRSRVFEALFTTKRDTGTGLGLWVSKQIVEKHGGTIRFRTRASGENTGSVFRIVLEAESTRRSGS